MQTQTGQASTEPMPTAEPETDTTGDNNPSEQEAETTLEETPIPRDTLE